jgi:hypothetical protein
MKNIGEAVYQLRGNLVSWRIALLIFVLFLLTFLSLVLFFTTREASLFQLLVTALSALLSIAFFSLFQSALLLLPEYKRPGELLHHSLRSFWKVILITLPVILVMVLFYLLINRIESNIKSEAEWIVKLLSTLRAIAFAFIFPLLLVLMWTSTVRSGIRSTVRQLHKLLLLSFSGRSLLLFSLGFLLFALLPWLILSIKTQVANDWLELALLLIRLIIAFMAFFIGWSFMTGKVSELVPKDLSKEAELESV